MTEMREMPGTGMNTGAAALPVRLRSVRSRISESEASKETEV